MDFLPKSEKILVILSPEIEESCYQKAEGDSPPPPPTPRARAATESVALSQYDYIYLTIESV